MDGLGRPTISINFPNPETLPSRIIQLMGANGSGKTTLMNNLHPLPKPMDQNNSCFILPDSSGYKKVTFRSKDKVIKIQHEYTRRGPEIKLKCFFELNKEQLNKNGGVRTFEDLVQIHFGITDQFFKSGRIGATTENFINLSPTRRKEFVYENLPSISDYVDAFKAIKERYARENRTISILSADLQDLDSLQTLKDRHAELTTALNEKESTKEEVIKKISKAETNISRIKENDDFENIKDVNEKLEQANANLAECEKELEKEGNHSKETVEAKISKYREKVSDLKAVLNQKEERLNNLKLDIAETEAAIKKKNAILQQKFSNKDSIADLEKELKDLSKDIKESADSPPKIKKNPIRTNTPEKAKIYSTEKAISVFNVLSSFANEVSEIYQIINAHSASLSESDKEEFTKLVLDVIRGEASFQMDVEEALESIETIGIKKSNLRNEIAVLRDKAKSLNILDQRPDECKSKKCLYVIQAESGKDAKATARVKEEELQKLEAETESLLNSINEHKAITKCKSALANVASRWTEVKSKEINSYFGIDESINPVVFLMTGKKTKAVLGSNANPFISFIPYAEEFSTYISEAYQLESKKKRRKEIKDSLTLLNEGSSYSQSISREISELKEKLKRLSSKLENIDSEYHSQKEEYEKSNRLLGKYMYIEKQLELKAELTTTIKSYKKIVSKNSEAFEELAKQTKYLKIRNDKLEVLESEIEVLKRRYDQASHQYEKAKNLVKKIKVAEENILPLKIIKDACDPKIGLPLIFLQDFLNELEQLTNELFEFAFKGRFRIDFFINESEFKIGVLKETGDIVSDVNQTSEGQKALIKTIISLALLSRHTKKFPIFSLDEIDATLDTNNRSNFANILNGQIEKLNLQQVFIVSHNENFRNSDIPVVLFKGHTLDKKIEKNLVIADLTT
jgi:DNA repair exonuclease SbcCD ATPase subunit